MDKGNKKPGGLKMDIIEKWNKIVDHYKENINTPECDIQKAWVDFFADTDFFGYSKFNKEVDDQRSIQIGSTQRVIPDIIIRSNQEQHDLFVVELKRYSKMEGHNQLFSYLKLLNLNIGVLVCSKLYIYDYDIVNTNDEQAFIEIAFEKDNPDGIKFMELFSKGSFDKENIKQFIRERKVTKNNIQLIQDKIDQTLIYNLLKEHFTTHFSVGEFNEAVKDMEILIEKEKSMNNTIYSIPKFESKGKEKNDLNKYEIQAICTNNGIHLPNNPDEFTKAKLNAGTPKYWANPNKRFLYQTWWLILVDLPERKLHIFKIPANSIRENELRYKNSNLIDLQIHYNDHHHPNFTDSRSNLEFKRWLIKTIPY
jgi:hypothetical protein